MPALAHQPKPSWTVFELTEAHPGEVVITDDQIVRALLLLKDYARGDECNCAPDEGNAPPNKCRRCSASALIGAITSELI